MLRKEFEIRTGIFPSSELYQIIEMFYSETDIDKDDFCKAYKENRDGLAEKIQQKADREAYEEQKKRYAELERTENEVERLKKALERKQEELDRELGWKPRGVLSQMDQERYEKLAAQPDTCFFSEQQAKDWIEEEFGFSFARIQIIKELATYDVNKYNVLRKSGTVERKPAYNATDWNYIRFNCGHWQYEVINGELSQYCD